LKLIKFNDFYLNLRFLKISSASSSTSGVNSIFDFNYGILLGLGGLANSFLTVIVISFYANNATYSV
jgi:hypothetical protein